MLQQIPLLSVSILVLMEYALRRAGKPPASAYIGGVSILVLMEYALRRDNSAE